MIMVMLVSLETCECYQQYSMMDSYYTGSSYSVRMKCNMWCRKRLFWFRVLVSIHISWIEYLSYLALPVHLSICILCIKVCCTPMAIDRQILWCIKFWNSPTCLANVSYAAMRENLVQNNILKCQLRIEGSHVAMENIVISDAMLHV